MCFGLVARLVSVGAMVLGVGVAFGQDYPNKPVRIFTAGAGSGSDFTARIISAGITGPLRQPVIVENRGNGILAAEIVAKSPPDGHSLTLQGGAFWIAPLLQKLPYEVSEFVPISMIEKTVLVVAVNTSLPVKSIKELIALAKAKPGVLNYGSSISGGAGHLAGELLNSEAGIRITRVPYKNTALSVGAAMSGEVQVVFADVGLVMPHEKAGRLRPLAVTSLEASVLAPALPTVASSGLRGFEMETGSGILAPAKTPPAIINLLYQEIARVVNRPEVKERFLNAGLEPMGISPEQYAAKMKVETAKISKLIKDADIKAD